VTSPSTTPNQRACENACRSVEESCFDIRGVPAPGHSSREPASPERLIKDLLRNNPSNRSLTVAAPMCFRLESATRRVDEAAAHGRVAAIRKI
jgi:hypothetical protein